MEITGDISLKFEEETLLDMHSVLNVLNIVTLELMILGDKTGCAEILKPAIGTVKKAALDLVDKKKAYIQVARVEEHIRAILGVLELVSINVKSSEEKLNELRLSRENLEMIFSVLRVRAREISARAEDPDGWVEHSISELDDNFSSVFNAISLNSKGEYGIVSNIACKRPCDYLVNLRIEGVLTGEVYMPAVFQDVMRDLLANARKYTPVGGQVDAGFFQSEDLLKFVVKDNGRGIPPGEISETVRFGKRGSNVSDKPTRGGGFGLTKAYFVTRKFNGRMWIESQIDHGCRVEIQIPVG